MNANSEIMLNDTSIVGISVSAPRMAMGVRGLADGVRKWRVEVFFFFWV
jgi:hypothetical protein